MRQRAWLHAVPKAANEKAITETDKRTRLERMRDKGQTPELPPLNDDPLVRLLFQEWPALDGGMGLARLTHEEVRAMQDNMGITLPPGEVDFLRRLSAEWIAESGRAKEADCPAPWVDPETTEYRLEVLPNRIKAFLRD